jgi:hypothetical protein
MVNKGIRTRIRRLEVGGMNPRHRPCPACGRAVGRIITLDPQKGVGVLEALGCAECERLRRDIPRGSRPMTIVICRSTPPADPRRAELLERYAVTDEDEEGD